MAPWHVSDQWAAMRPVFHNDPRINNYLKVYQMNLKPHPSWLIYDILPKDTLW